VETEPGTAPEGPVSLYPKPFNASAKTDYRFSAVSFVTLEVYDILARETAVLVNQSKRPGRYETRFDAADVAGPVYSYTVAAGNRSRGPGPRATSSGFLQTRKVVVVKESTSSWKTKQPVRIT